MAAVESPATVVVVVTKYEPVIETFVTIIRFEIRESFRRLICTGEEKSIGIRRHSRKPGLGTCAQLIAQRQRPFQRSAK